MHAMELIVVLAVSVVFAHAAELMGGHYDNFDSQKNNADATKKQFYANSESTTDELIPDPSALIIPGYNLPGHLFNDGKPFYVEKDPLTGSINFNNKTPAGKEYNSNDYDYFYDEPSADIYDKANIDRKDSGFGSHRPNDVNQLTPNFHDFLPVKYNNPEKYAYPLISSSYANTKIQGNVNNYNHKQYSATTYKPTVSPTYYTTKSVYYTPSTIANVIKTSVPTTITTPSTIYQITTSKEADSYYKPSNNLMNSPMNHPSYLTTVDNEYDYDYFTTQRINDLKHVTTEQTKKQIYITKPSTTKKPYSIFDELFGDYEEPETTESPESHYYESSYKDVTETTTTPKPSSVSTTSTTTTTTTAKTTVTQSTTKQPEISSVSSSTETVSQVFPEDDHNVYEYIDDYNNNYSDTSITTTKKTDVKNESKQEVTTEKLTTVMKNETKSFNTTEKPINNQTPSNFHQNFDINKQNVEMRENTTRYSDRFDTLPAITTETIDNNYISITTEKYNYLRDKNIGQKVTKSPESYTTPSQPTLIKVTSMPLGDNHPTKSRLPPPVFTLTQNLKESLNREKISTTTKTYPKPIHFEHKQSVLHPAPSTSNIHIAPDQDMVSFVVGNHQNVEGSHYIGTAVKDEPYISNSFRPLYSQQNSLPKYDQIIYNRPNIKDNMHVNYISQTLQSKNNSGSSFNDVGSSTTIKIQPIHGSQASISIGVPADDVKTVPGQVVDEKLDINDSVEFPKETGSKVVFPQDDLPSYSSSKPNPNREILSLYSKPMFHQLPADLTPPSEPEVKPVRNPGVPRPPWDPRPGHFYQGRPEYARPPRPHKPEIFKRTDKLPNILPQFRPNARISNNHYGDSMGAMNTGYMPRQPLLDRPSNRPIGFFEKLHPPPPPKRIHELRKVTALEPERKHDRYKIEERILNVQQNEKPQDHYGSFQMPPKVPVANRKSEDESEITTLQMIQVKQSEKLDSIKPNVPPPFKIKYQETSEKPIYVVYPVNSSPLKLDVLDNDKTETVVVGTRGEQLPLPPSKINQEPQQYEQKPLLKLKDRNDSPILKPHSRPNYPIKSDFPYILEKPDPTLVSNPISTSTELDSQNNLDTTIPTTGFNSDFIKYQGGNQWTSLDTESKIVTGNKLNFVNDQISVTLKTFTEKEKPIAIAYTPTEPTYNKNDKYSIPNFSRPAIPEIRPEATKYGTVSNDDSEITVSAVMHTHPQLKLKPQTEIKYFNPDNQIPVPAANQLHQENLENHKLNLDVDTTHVPAKLDFQAPFHASVSIDSEYQGWSVVNSKNKIDRADTDVTPSPSPETTSEFDIENFKPKLYGGFKPIYNFPEKENESTSDEIQTQE